jgi:site-specific DNA-methyltransferase (adenine-specific)
MWSSRSTNASDRYVSGLTRLPTKLSLKDARKVRELRSEKSVQELSDQFNVTVDTIRLVLDEIIWKDRKYELVHQVANPHGFVYCCDCRDLMTAMLESDIRYRLCFADPPFGIGVDYDGEFDDTMTSEEYLDFTRSWVSRIPELLLDGGRLYAHVPDQCVYAVLSAAKEAGMILNEWIVYHYRFGQCQKSRYITSKCHGLVFTNNSEKLVWRSDDIRVASDRAAIYNDPRTQSTETPGLRVPFDVWGANVSTFSEGELLEGDGAFWGRVPGNSKERRSLHENQLPEVYLQRIIKGYTRPNDWVFDPFGGSGTTIVVARALGRNCVTSEQSDTYAQSIAERVVAGAVRQV